MDSAVKSNNRSNETERRPQVKGRFARYGYLGLLTVAGIVVIVGLQSMVFYMTFVPRAEEASRLLFDLVVESADRELNQRIAERFGELMASQMSGKGPELLRDAWESFHVTFPTEPTEAIRKLQSQLRELDKTERADLISTGLQHDLDRFSAIYEDRYRDILDQLDDTSFYLWPTAPLLARCSGFRDTVTFNSALHLAQVGEIGTARVMLVGLGASTDNKRLAGLIYYMLGRLEFELFRSRPELDLYSQAVQYMRQSLQVDPSSELAKRFLDYLLSFSQGETVPGGKEGDPTTLSEGEGAAISADKRRF